MDDDMDFQHDLKRFKYDHDITKELMDSEMLPAVIETLADMPVFTRKELVSRQRDDKLVKVPKDKLLRLPYQDVRGVAENLYFKVPRPQWHPSYDNVILKQIGPNCFQTKQVTVVPLLHVSFIYFLISYFILKFILELL